MFRYLKSKKAFFTIVIVTIVLLNLYTLYVAFPSMTGPLNLAGVNLPVHLAHATAKKPTNTSAATAFNVTHTNSTMIAAAIMANKQAGVTNAEPRDFSVYYIAAWRILHNPSQIFTVGSLKDGEPSIYPYLTPYKYLPSFLILISPLTALSYYQAFWVFDAIQFALLPFIALLLYKLLGNKSPLIVFLIMVAVLLLPYPMSGRGLSVSYFMQWAEGQAKVFLTFLLLVSFYFGYRGRPVLSGVAFALGAFDVRFMILALPLFLFYNKEKLRTAIGTATPVFIISNFMVFYPGVAQGFLNMLLTAGGSTPFYTPSYIPLAMIGCLSLSNARPMVDNLKDSLPRINAHLKTALKLEK